MKTYEMLKEETTPEFIKKLSKLAEGFEYAGLMDFVFCGQILSIRSGAFPLLLHRTVEEINTDGYCPDTIEYQRIAICCGHKSYRFKNYEPCHLTQCEMAIWDCLLGLLK